MNKIVTIDPSTQDEIVPKHNLLGLSYPQLVAFFADIEEKAFRASQVMKWIHQYGVTDFTQMTARQTDTSGDCYTAHSEV